MYTLLHRPPSCVTTHLCFWGPPRTWAQEGARPASRTAVAVARGNRTAAAPGPGKDPPGPSAPRGSWGTKRSAAPCSRGSPAPCSRGGTPAGGNPEPGSPAEAGLGPGSRGRWGRCPDTEGAAQSSSLGQTGTWRAKKWNILISHDSKEAEMM